MHHLPQPIHDAAASFDRLPRVGPRASLRYAYWLVTQPKEVIECFARSIQNLVHGVTTCAVCFQWAETSPCAVCQDLARDKQIICVVATSQDVRVVEDTGVFKGLYHVLGGTLDPIEGRTAETLTFEPLVQRLKTADPPIKELILAFDANIPGDTTALYVRQQVSRMTSNQPLRITRLARGLPTGASLEYADANTLADADKRKDTGT